MANPEDEDTDQPTIEDVLSDDDDAVLRTHLLEKEKW
jgi:hypothetical protein